MRLCPGLAVLDLSAGGGLLPGAGGLVGSPRRRAGATGPAPLLLAPLVGAMPALRRLEAESSGLTDRELMAAAEAGLGSGLLTAAR